MSSSDSFFINFKVISVCSRNRDTKTWQIHIAHSIIVTIFFAFDLPFVTISNALPHLSIYTGDWFCYMASFIVNYEVYFLVTNSFLIAVMKYIYIVHWDKAMRFGHEKIQRIFLVVRKHICEVDIKWLRKTKCCTCAQNDLYAPHFRFLF